MEIRKSFKRLKALAFIIPNDVVIGFKLIQAEAPLAFSPMLVYFEKYLIGKLVGKTTNLRKIPCFPIKLWNCYSRVLNDRERTNNTIESWHKQFENDCGKHPIVNKLVEQMRVEQKNTEIVFKQIQSGDIYVKKLAHLRKTK